MIMVKQQRNKTMSKMHTANVEIFDKIKKETVKKETKGFYSIYNAEKYVFEETDAFYEESRYRVKTNIIKLAA